LHHKPVAAERLQAPRVHCMPNRFSSRRAAKRWQSSQELLGEGTATHCSQVLRESSWGAGSSGPVILTYATGVPHNWMLGLTAAQHGLPIAIAGHGFPPWNWWEKNRKKLPGSMRAAQVLAESAPGVPIALVDASDTFIVNKWFAKSHLRGLGEQGRHTILLGAECNSWPRCYREQYLHDAAFQRCTATSGSCYPNSGVALASNARTLVDLLAAQLRQLQVMDSNRAGYNDAEMKEDQAALHHLYLNRSEGLHRHNGFKLRIDGASSTFLNLWSCREEGPHQAIRDATTGLPRAVSAAKLAARSKAARESEFCHERRHLPLESVHIGLRGGRLTYNSSGEVQLPWLVHANGYHSRGRDPVFAPLLRRFDPPPAELFSYPVALLDAMASSCTVTTLGALIQTHNQTRA